MDTTAARSAENEAAEMDCRLCVDVKKSEIVMNSRSVVVHHLLFTRIIEIHFDSLVW